MHRVFVAQKWSDLDAMIDFYAARVDWYSEWITEDIRAFLAGRRRSNSGRP